MYNNYKLRPSYREFEFWYASVSLPTPTPPDCCLFVYTMYYQCITSSRKKQSGNQDFDEISYICILTTGFWQKKRCQIFKKRSCKVSWLQRFKLNVLSLLFINAYLVIKKKHTKTYKCVNNVITRQCSKYPCRKLPNLFRQKLPCQLKWQKWK